MSLLDDVVNQLAGQSPAAPARPSAPVRSNGDTIAESAVREPQAAPEAAPQKVTLTVLVEAKDEHGRREQLTRQVDVPKGSLKMLSLLGEGADNPNELLRQLVIGAIAAAMQTVSAKPGGLGTGQVIEQIASKPGPVGGRSPEKRDPLADMLGLDLIEHQVAKESGQVRGDGGLPQIPQPRPARPQGPHTTGPAPPSHLR